MSIQFSSHSGIWSWLHSAIYQEDRRFKSAGIQFLSRRRSGQFGLFGKLDQGKGVLSNFLEVPVVVSREPSLMQVGEPRNPVSAG